MGSPKKTNHVLQSATSISDAEKSVPREIKPTTTSPYPASDGAWSPPAAAHLPAIVSPDRRDSALCFFYANRVVALDCEMVGVGPGGQRSVLARVTVVNFFGQCLFDTFVRVEERVTDYRTHVSGVTEQSLTSPYAMSFARCRELVKDLVRNKILVGHALENDLNVLGIEHPWYNTRDTALYGPYMRVDQCGRYFPRRLKELADTYLGMSIQKYGSCHNPMEDACAALALYRRVQSQWDYEMDHQRRNAVLHTRIHDILPAF